jgi:hypothetical protein
MTTRQGLNLKKRVCSLFINLHSMSIWRCGIVDGLRVQPRHPGLPKGLGQMWRPVAESEMIDFQVGKVDIGPRYRNKLSPCLHMPFSQMLVFEVSKV